MTDKLSLYNGALTELGERKLASLAEQREPRRVLDGVWTRDAIIYCLEQGQWKFALRTVQLDYSPSVEPPFGYKFAFNKPDDFVRTVAISSDEYFTDPLLEYADEAGFLFADYESIFLRLVSSAAEYGFDYSKWPKSFTRFAEVYLASLASPKITQSESKTEGLEKKSRMLLKDARSIDAVQGPAKFAPQGSWVRARRGGGGTRDRGSRGRLIG